VDKYRFVDTHCRAHAVGKLCRTLGISRSGYYAWKARKPGKREHSNQRLSREILRLHQKYPALGLDSIYHILRRNHICSRSRIHRLMKRLNVHSVRKKAFRVTTNSKHNHPIAPNLLKRNFHADRPDQVWVGDITYIPTGEGWLYLAIVKDLCTKKVVGYAFSEKIDTALTLEALRMAYRRQNPKPGLIFHSDRGVQYAANNYRETLRLFHITQSMSRKGDPYDNAVAENFFSCLKLSFVTLSDLIPGHRPETLFLLTLRAFTTTFVLIQPLVGSLPKSGRRVCFLHRLRNFEYFYVSFRFRALLLSIFSRRAHVLQSAASSVCSALRIRRPVDIFADWQRGYIRAFTPHFQSGIWMVFFCPANSNAR